MTNFDRKKNQALQHLQMEIETAWINVRRSKENNARALRSFHGRQEIKVGISEDSGGDAFACQPSLATITMKWWALEVLWLTAFVFQNLGARLWRHAEDGNTSIALENDVHLLKGRDALAHAANLIENRESRNWPENITHPAENKKDLERTNKVFLKALGWIELHEVAHITVDESIFSGAVNPSIAEEEYCDSYATNWVLAGNGKKLPSQREGVAVATFFLVLREVLCGRTGPTHPNSQSRVAASQISDRHGGWLAIIIDIMLQSGRHSTPALSGKDYTPKTYLRASFDAMYDALSQK